MQTTQSGEIQNWHFEYRRLTGLDVKLNYYRESQWAEFLRYMRNNRPDFCMADFSAVIAVRKKRQKERSHGAWSLSFNGLIGSPEIVEEELAEARANARTHKPTSKDKVMAQSGREPSHVAEAKPVRDVLAESKAIQDLKVWKQQMGFV